MVELSAEQSDQKLRATFFRSITLVTSASALILAASEGRFFPAGITPVVAVVAWIFVDHYRTLRIPVLVGNLFGLVALWLATNEFLDGTVLRKLLSGAHLVVYLSWIVLLLPKSHRQYWWLMALSVLELAIGGIVSGDVAFGAALMGMMLLMLWTMSVFSLYRVQDQHARSPGETVLDDSSELKDRPLSQFSTATNLRPKKRPRNARSFLRSFFGLRAARQTADSGSSALTESQSIPLIIVRNGLQRDAAETWVGWRFRGMVSGSFVISLILAFIVFAAFPRVWIPGLVLGDIASEHLATGGRTGFSNSVALGDIGRIMQSNARVLTFDAVDLKTQKPMTAEELADGLGGDELRFRGNVFARYFEGQWYRGYSLRETSHEDRTHRPGNYSPMLSDIRVNIVQDPPQELFAFAPYPVSRIISARKDRVLATENRACLIWQERPQSESQSRAFSVELPRLKSDEGIPFEYWNPSRDIPGQSREETLDKLQAKAERLFLSDGTELRQSQSERGMLTIERRVYVQERDLPYALPGLFQIAHQICSDEGQLVPAAERVQRIMSYLSPENGFRYSLTPTRKDISLDPVEDFLFNTKTGHCEYFASACTLMLQAVKVPARLINGYYGSELNSVTGKDEVRQRHAHAWTEAWVDSKWQTLEATPAADREALLPRNESITLMSNIQDAISDFWNDGIHNMSAQRQQEFFAPVISTSKSLYETIQEQGLLATARRWIVVFASSPERWVSWQGGVVTFLLLAAIAGLMRVQAFQRLRKHIQALWGLRSPRHKSLKSVIRFYEGFCTLCERHGLKLSPSNSALENAQIATREFQSKISSAEILSLPVRIAEAFNQVRFGNQPLSDEQAATISRDLQRFAELLK
jgi:hypothetical protein